MVHYELEVRIGELSLPALLCAERLLQSCFLLPQPHAELREVATRREAERRRQSK